MPHFDVPLTTGDEITTDSDGGVFISGYDGVYFSQCLGHVIHSIGESDADLTQLRDTMLQLRRLQLLMNISGLVYHSDDPDEHA